MSLKGQSAFTGRLERLKSVPRLCTLNSMQHLECVSLRDIVRFCHKTQSKLHIARRRIRNELIKFHEMHNLTTREHYNC